MSTSSPAVAQTTDHDPHGFDLRAYLAQHQAHVDAALERAIEATSPRSLHEAMRYSLLSGGKRLRPILCIASCELLGGTRDAAMPTACALEMLHTASLIHDDLPAMDDDDLRRGKLANHKVYGEGIALLAGDALLVYALELIMAHTRGLPSERVLRVMHTVCRHVGVSGLIGGQVVDLESAGAREVTLETLELIHTRKTASLVEAAVATGAILAGAGEEALARLGRYARNVGLAFQIIDDVLDVTATGAELGKTPGKDARAGKATYPRLLGVAASRRLADEYIARARRELDAFGGRALPLAAVAEYVRTRTH